MCYERNTTMKVIEYRKIIEECAIDLQLPNEPFKVFGRMIINRNKEKWSYETEMFTEAYYMTFPEEEYSFEMITRNGFALGAYENGSCIGLAIFQNDPGKYMYLYDLKVNKEFRRKGIAEELISSGLKLVRSLGYVGIYTIGQDNNLAACKFYLKQNFVIGGLNTDDYKHTKQEGKSNIYFYLD